MLRKQLSDFEVNNLLGLADDLFLCRTFNFPWRLIPPDKIMS